MKTLCHQHCFIVNQEILTLPHNCFSLEPYPSKTAEKRKKQLKSHMNCKSHFCKNFLRIDANLQKCYQTLVKNVQHCNNFASLAILVQTCKNLVGIDFGQIRVLTDYTSACYYSKTFYTQHQNT